MQIVFPQYIDDAILEMRDHVEGLDEPQAPPLLHVSYGRLRIIQMDTPPLSNCWLRQCPAGCV